MIRTILGLLSRRTPTTPHLCEDCGGWATSITPDQRERFQLDGTIPCPCGGILRPVQQQAS